MDSTDRITEMVSKQLLSNLMTSFTLRGAHSLHPVRDMAESLAMIWTDEGISLETHIPQNTDASQSISCAVGSLF